MWPCENSIFIYHSKKSFVSEEQKRIQQLYMVIFDWFLYMFTDIFRNYIIIIYSCKKKEIQKKIHEKEILQISERHVKNSVLSFTTTAIYINIYIIN